MTKMASHYSDPLLKSASYTVKGRIMHECMAISKRVAATTALVSIAIPLAVAQALSPTLMFEGNTTTPAKNGATQTVHIVVQSWAIAGQEHDIPLRGFYVAHLLSGQISTTIGGQTTERLPGDYWTVKTGAAMQVKVIGEVAVLETIVMAKQ